MAEQTGALTGAETVAWELGELYTGVDDPAIERDLQRAHQLADQIAETYKGKVGSLAAPQLAGMIALYEQIEEIGHRLGMYAQMLWSTNTEDQARGALVARITEEGSRLAQKLVFVGLEWAHTDDAHAAAVMAAPEVARQRHWVETTRQQRPYMLTEPEERILAEKATTGRNAWSRLFDEVHGANRYELDSQQVPEQVVLARLYHPDRDVRREAADILTGGLRKISRVTTYVFNQILADKASDDRLRGYPAWISARNLSNEVADASVEALIQAVTSRYDIVARYYNLKKNLLGLDQLFDYDRYAPLPAAERDYTWDESREVVLNAFGAFHPRVAEIAESFFKRRWIDAPVRPGKRGGAYAMPGPPSLHPFVFLNFQGKARDVETLAHELGHGIHMVLSQKQSILEAGTPLTTAETASVFGEALVFNDLLQRESDPRIRLAMLTARIEGSFATVFRQVSMNRFEDAIHTARRSEGELSTERFSELWLTTQRTMFEGSVTMTDNYGLWWSYIPHFINTPGYVYAYAFGELLVLALYARYQQAPQGFAERYIEMLAAGGSDWPHEIVRPMGVDLTDLAFWQHGVQILDDLVAEAETLAGQL